MISKLKLYFDACCSTRLATDLLAQYESDSPGLETRHLFQDARPDTADPTWLAKIQHGGWIVVTCDRGKDRRTAPLPQVCRELGITHIALSPKLLNKGFNAQKTALVTVWELLVHLDQYPAGSQVRLGENGVTKAGRVRYALKVVMPDGRLTTVRAPDA